MLTTKSMLLHLRSIKFYILFSFIYFFQSVITINAQNNTDNLFKYWYYRNRLEYFVIPGERRGESQIVGLRNRFDETYNDLAPSGTRYYKVSTPGQHGVMLGYYISMLATEYRLLMNYGKTTEAAYTLFELNQALVQYITYMDECETYWELPDIYDGFFVRDNFPCDFLDTDSLNGFTSSGKRHLDLLNKNLTMYNVWDDTNKTFRGLSRGHPGYTDYINATMCGYDTTNQTKKPMSKDDAIGMLMGLALVSKLCPGTTEANVSKDIACKIIKYIRNKYFAHGPFAWQIYVPDLTVPEDGGGVSWPYAFAFEKAANKISPGCLFYDVSGPGELIWQVQKYFPVTKIYNNSMSATLAAMGKSWKIGISIYIGCCSVWCPGWLCLHIPIQFNATGLGIRNVTGLYHNETFYLLLYNILHNKSTNYLDENKVRIQMNNAPCEGPYNYGNGIDPPSDPYGGWSSVYRWRDYWGEQVGNYGFQGNFNGLAYMVFYNLSHLFYGGVTYENYNDRYLSGTVNNSGNLLAFKTLTSTQVIDAQNTPVVNYRAGEQIELKPGFHAKAGAEFHAHIGRVGCGDTVVTDTVFHPSPLVTSGEDSCQYVSLPPMICGYDTMYFNGIDDDTANTFSYYWDFGPYANPTVSNIRNPKVHFSTAGTFPITLSITDTVNPPHNTLRLCIFVDKPECTEEPDTMGNPETKRYNDTGPDKGVFYVTGNRIFKLYPNPASSILNVICSDNNCFYSTDIYNVLGKNVFSVKTGSGFQKFDMSLLPDGIYFIRLNTCDGSTITEKIVIKKSE